MCVSTQNGTTYRKETGSISKQWLYLFNCNFAFLFALNSSDHQYTKYQFFLGRYYIHLCTYVCMYVLVSLNSKINLLLLTSKQRIRQLFLNV